MSNCSELCGRRVRHSDLVIPWDFVICHWGLRITVYGKPPRQFFQIQHRFGTTFSGSSSQTHLAKNELENVLQADDAHFALIATEDNGESLAASLHSSHGLFQSRLVAQVEGRFQVMPGALARVEVVLIEQGLQTQHAHDTTAVTLASPDRQAGAVVLAAELERLVHGGLGVHRDGLFQRRT